MTPHSQPNLSVGRNLKIGLFHLGSGIADVIATGIWNRVMISDLGYAATPVGLLVSLRYFLAPLSVWAGRMSDQRVIGGYRRLFWIWLGRGMMVLSSILLGWITGLLTAAGGAVGMAGQDLPHWIGIGLALLMFSIGSAISGSTFLALIYDRAPEHQRGRAIGIVWTFLMIGYAVGGFALSRLLPPHAEGQAVQFTPETILNLFVIASLMMAGIWFISLVGEERRAQPGETARVSGQQEYTTSAIADLRLALSLRPMRFFMIYLAVSMFFAFSQDLILEPFGGQVFGMDASITTRFTGYWASMAIVGTVAFIFLSRRFKSLTNTVLSYAGAGLLLLTFALFAYAAFTQQRPLVTPGLILLGLGLGIWNVGTLGLMMDMSPVGRAGTFLGFWTLVVTLARGGGVASGGILRDLGLSLTGSVPAAYGIVFALGVIGLGLSIYALRQANIQAFKARQTQPETAAVLAGAMD
jgi:BCD family chlorophyll transporter-like MFS transporter